jgi:transposase
LDDTQAKVRQIEARLAQWHRNSRLSRLLATVPGVGIMGASAIAATVSDPSLFRPGPWAREHRSSIPRAIDFEEAIRFRDVRHTVNELLARGGLGAGAGTAPSRGSTSATH